MSEPPTWIGIDVAKAWLDVASTGEAPVQRFANAAAGIAALGTALAAPAPASIVLEATGGHERAVSAALAAAGRPVAVVNPRQVRDFAKATGRLAKSDALDARNLTHVAQRIHPPVRPLPDETTREGVALLARRRQVIAMRSAEQNRRPSLAARLRPGLDAHLVWLSRQRGELDRELDQRLRDSPLWRENEALLRAIPGSGPVVARPLLGELPQLGTGDRWEMAALAGIAPRNRDSGTRHGPRRTWGGRGPVRAARSMAAVVATRCHPVIRALYQRLRAAGQPVKVALLACRRKLCTIANAILRDGVPWRADPALGA
jgi:transposase